MKKLLFLCLPLALLYACGEKPHKTELVFDKTQEGLRITSVRDTFNKYKGTYYVSATIKNDTKEVAQNFVVTGKYIDKVGDAVAESSNGVGKAIAPGDSLVIENSYQVSSYEKVPYKTSVTVKTLF